jgi:hypothetical protein
MNDWNKENDSCPRLPAEELIETSEARAKFSLL